MVAEADHWRVVLAGRTLAARRRIGERRGPRGRGALGFGGDTLAGRALGVMAPRIGVAARVAVRALARLDRRGAPPSVPVRALGPLDRRGALGASVCAAAATLRPLAPRRLSLVVGRQLSAILPVDLARDELLDLGDRLLVDARDEGQRLARFFRRGRCGRSDGRNPRNDGARHS